VAVASGKRSLDPTVERLDGGVEHASGSVQVVRPEGIRVARQAGSRVMEGIGREPEPGGELVGLKRLEIGPWSGRSIIGPPIRSHARIGPGCTDRQQLGELGPGGRVRIAQAGSRRADERWEKSPGIGQGQGARGVGDQPDEVVASQLGRRLVD
jgi:hypothetical protein